MSDILVISGKILLFPPLKTRRPCKGGNLGIFLFSSLFPLQFIYFTGHEL